MPVHSFTSVQKLPVSLEEAWSFFSNPENLAVLTPEYLNLKFTNELFGDRMYPGQVITHKINPILGIPIYWMTEIIHVEPLKYFVDEQRVGPYSLWHHQHHFKSVEGGVEMTDLIHYKNPLGPLGVIANSLFVRKQLEEIFAYRYKKVEEIFGGKVLNGIQA